jgi:hypothetical protein
MVDGLKGLYRTFDDMCVDADEDWIYGKTDNGNDMEDIISTEQSDPQAFKYTILETHSSTSLFFFFLFLTVTVLIDQIFHLALLSC